MEMEFKDSSRRRTLVLIVGVLLALVAGAGVFYLSSQGGSGGSEPITALPTREIVVAVVADPRALDDRSRAAHDTRRAGGCHQRDRVHRCQPGGEPGRRRHDPRAPAHHAEPPGRRPERSSIADPLPDRDDLPDLAHLARREHHRPGRSRGRRVRRAGNRVDVVATIPIAIDPAIDDRSRGEEVGTGLPQRPVHEARLDGRRDPGNGGADGAPFVLKMDLHQAEEVAHAQTMGAAFTISSARPATTERSTGAATARPTNLIIEQYNFPIPEALDGAVYPQPSTFPSPFPNTPYLSPPPSVAPSPSVLPGASPAASPAA